mgnify:CR=1 FL=1
MFETDDYSVNVFNVNQLRYESGYIEDNKPNQRYLTRVSDTDVSS